MVRSLYVARTGLDAQQTNLDVISNNLANVTTTGFKRARAEFQDLVYQTIRQPGGQSSQQTQVPTGLQMGAGVKTVANPKIFTQGPLTQTENSLDIAINGDGFFQIQMPDGTTAYTRNGEFTKDNNGQVVTQDGYYLIPNITIPQDATSLTIGAAGNVSVTTAGTTEITNLGDIQLVTFINPSGLASIGKNLFMETAASGVPTPNTPGLNGTGTLEQGFVENSNVNVAEEMVAMIITQRAYEINAKAITTSDNMLGRLTQL